MLTVQPGTASMLYTLTDQVSQILLKKQNLDNPALA